MLAAAGRGTRCIGVSKQIKAYRIQSAAFFKRRKSASGRPLGPSCAVVTRVTTMPEEQTLPAEAPAIGAFRYSCKMRLLLTMLFISQLTTAEVVDLVCEWEPEKRDRYGRVTATPLLSKSRMTDVNKTLLSEIRDLDDDYSELLDYNLEGGVSRNEERNLKDANKYWMKHLLQHGSLLDQKPPGRPCKRLNHLDTLTSMRNILVAGYVHRGQLYMYRNIADACKRSTAAHPFERLFSKLKVTYVTAWKWLKATFPELCYRNARLKKQRTASEVQGCATEIIGKTPLSKRPDEVSKQGPQRKPVTFPSFYRQCEHLAYLFNPHYEFFYDLKYLQHQWFIDAFTVDPAALKKSFRGIWQRGTPPPVISTALANANVASLPSFMCVVALNVKHDALIFFPDSGVTCNCECSLRQAVAEFCFVRVCGRARVVQVHQRNMQSSLALCHWVLFQVICVLQVLVAAGKTVSSISTCSHNTCLRQRSNA